MKAAESRRAAALAVEVAELKQQVAILTADSSLCPSLSQDTPRSLSDAVTRQVSHRISENQNHITSRTPNKRHEKHTWLPVSLLALVLLRQWVGQMCPLKAFWR